MTEHEQYLFHTVRIKFRNKLNHPCNRVGIVQGLTTKKLFLLALDDDEDCEIPIERSKIDKIEKTKKCQD